MTKKQKFEYYFFKLGQLAYDYPWRFIAGSLLLFFFCTYQLQFLHIDTTTEGFLEKTDPALIEFEEFKKTFGRDEQFVVVFKSDQVFTQEFLSRLAELHDELEIQIPYVDEVASLRNARDIYGEDDELIVDDLLETLPENAEQLEALKQKILSNDLLLGRFINKDANLVALYVRPINFFLNPDSGEYLPLADQEYHLMALKLEEVLQHYPDLTAEHYIAGMPATTDELNQYLVGDMGRFIFMALAMIALVLFFLFKKITSVLLPLLVMITSLVSTMGLMSITGQPVQMPTVILPSFILAVGVGDSIHLLTIYYRHLSFGVSKREASANALAHTGLPMFFTTITTAASLCSFGQSEILPVANLGLFAAAGVVFAFIYTIYLLPALLAVAPIKLPNIRSQSDEENSKKKNTWFDTFLDFSVKFASTQTKAIVITGVLAMAGLFYIALQLGFSHNPLYWLPETSKVRIASDYIGEHMAGAVTLEIIIDSGEVDGVKNPEFLRKIDELTEKVKQFKTADLAVGKAASATELIKETNQALFNNDPAEYRIPDNRELIAQELLMLETSGAEDLFKLFDKDYRQARITVLTPWVDALHYGEFSRQLDQLSIETMGDLATVKMTGIVPMLAVTLEQIMRATASSYAIAFVVITLMMIMLLGSVKYGLISMIPNLLPITLALALMQMTGAPLDMFSMLIGSIAIGLSVDDTVHFMHGFRRVYEKTGDAYKAVNDTLHSSGRAMLSTSIVLSAGFLIYLFSVMNNLQDFGFFTALCIIVALLADFWLAPALVLLINRNHKKAP
jgi:predicted RND superfamily exporter protein